MKAPKLKEFPTGAGEQEFTKQVKASNTDTPAPKKIKESAKKTEQERAKPKTFSLTDTDLSYINAHALKLSNERGRSVNGSEALRDIIEAHRGAGS